MSKIPDADMSKFGDGIPDADPSLFGPPAKPSGVIRRIADQGIKLGQGVVGVPEAVVGIADLASGGAAGKAVEAAGVRFKDAKEIMGEYLSPEQKAADAEVQQADGFLPTLGAMVKNPSTILGAVSESAPSMIGGGAIGRGVIAGINRVAPTVAAKIAAANAAPLAASQSARTLATTVPIAAGAAGEGIITAGQNAEQVRQQTPDGLLTPGQSAIIAASGLATGGINLASGKLANKLGIGDVNTMLAAGKLGPVGPDAVSVGSKKGLIRKIAEGAVNEGALQEMPQSWQEQVAQNLALGKQWDEGAGTAAAAGLLAGGFMGGGASGISHLAGGDTPPVAPAQPAPPTISAPIAALGQQWQAMNPGQTGSLAIQKAGQQAVDLGIENPADLLAQQRTQAQTDNERAGAAASRATDANIESVANAWKALGIETPAQALQRQRTWNPNGDAPAAPLGPISSAAAVAAASGAIAQPVDGMSQAKANNTFTGQAQGAGRLVGMTQPKGTPVEKLFSNFADMEMTPANSEVSAKFRASMLDRANADPRNFTDDPVATSSTATPDGLNFVVDSAKSGNTRIQVYAGGELVAAARAQNGMIDSIATDEDAKGKGIGAKLLQFIDANGIANIDEVPDRSPGFVKIQKQAIQARSAPRQISGESPVVGRPGEAHPTITDSQGQEYRVHSQRGPLVIAHPIVNGQAVVNSQTSVRFWTDPVRAPSGENDRLDPIYQPADYATSNPVSTTGLGASPAATTETQGETSEPQADQAQQAEAQRPQEPAAAGRPLAAAAVQTAATPEELTTRVAAIAKRHLDALPPKHSKEPIDRAERRSWYTAFASGDLSGPIKIEEVENPKGLKIGDRVQVGSATGTVYSINPTDEDRFPSGFQVFAMYDGGYGGSEDLGKLEKVDAPEIGPDREANLEAARDLLQAQKDATGNKLKEGAVRKKLRELASITPASDEKTVVTLDTAATRLGMGEGNTKGLEFAPAAGERDKAATQAPVKPKRGDAHPNATAPEHIIGDEEEGGVTVDELRQIAAAFREHIDSGGDADVTHVFDAPAKDEIFRLEKKAGVEEVSVDKKRVFKRGVGWMTPAEAKAEIAKWKENARKQGETRTNADKVVLSLFDLSGEWSKPWEEAGYQVYMFDIQSDPDMGDVNNFSVEFFSDWFGDFEGQDIYAVLAACPCTDFTVAANRFWAAKDQDGRTVSSVRLAKQTMNVIEYFKPAVWVMENPVGRIESLTGLPPWRASFHPFLMGDPYPKKTLLWGRFNGDMPVAPVEPTDAAKIANGQGGKSLATKNARSVTPEGFSYAFFQANNAIDHPLLAFSGKYDRLDKGALQAAIDAGLTGSQIADLVDDFYFIELDDDAANAALRKAAGKAPPPSAPTPPSPPPPPETPAVKKEITRAAAVDDGPEVVLQNRDRSSAASIGQMNAIAAKPDYLRAGQSNVMDSGSPIVFGSAPASALIGKSAPVVDGLGNRIQVQYAVVESSDLLSSHSADGSAIPEYANGVPGKYRAVAGNARTAGITEGYRRGTAAQYRSDLEEDAESMGINRAAVERMASPVLVRVMEEKDVTADIGDRSNIQSGADLSPVEQAATDARRVDLSTLEFNDDGDPTPASVMKFIQSMPVTEQGKLAPKGAPIRQAYSRLMAAVFKQAYGSDELVELYAQATDDEAKNILNAMAAVAGPMSALKGAGDYDVRGAVAEAAGYAINARRKGQKLVDMLKTPDMMMTDEAIVVAQLFADNPRSAKAIAAGLRDFAEHAQAQVAIEEANQSQGGMFGAKPTLDREQLFRRLNGNQDITPQDRIQRPARTQVPGAPVEGGGESGAVRGEGAGGQAETLESPTREQVAAQQDKLEPAAAPAVSANTIFTQDAYEAAKARLKASRGTLNSGIDPQTLLDGIAISGYHIEKGARTFAAYSKAMLEDLGDSIRPYLKSWYMAVKYDPRSAAFTGMDSAAAVESFNVDDRQAPPSAAKPAGELTEDESILANQYGTPDKPLIFSSGMSRRGDFGKALAADHSIGIEIGEMSDATISEIAQGLAKSKASLFVDTGAFGLFRAKQRAADRVDAARQNNLFNEVEAVTKIKPLDFDKIFDQYEKLARAISEADEEGYTSDRIFFVMPDEVGSQTDSLALLERFKRESSRHAKFAANTIVPLQGGDMTLTEMYDRAAKILGTNDFIVGVPSNAEAVSNADFAKLMRDRGYRMSGVHVLGAAADASLTPRIQAIKDSGFNGPVSADANRMRTLWTRGATRGEALDRLLATPATSFKYSDIPAQVKSKVQRAIDFLRDDFRKLSEVMDVHGDGVNLASDLKTMSHAILNHQEVLAEFRKQSKSKGIDAEGFINEIGGEPDFSRFGKLTTEPKVDAPAKAKPAKKDPPTRDEIRDIGDVTIKVPVVGADGKVTDQDFTTNAANYLDSIAEREKALMTVLEKCK